MILLMGVAGSGKSTQGKMLADKKGYAWISTGEILRVLITGTRRKQMLEGKLLSDDEMIKVMDKVFDLIDPNDEFVLDGFPRTTRQASWLMEQADKGRFSRIVVLNLHADEQDVKWRLLNRGRLDDTNEIIAKRFSEYKDVTLPILDTLKQHGVKIYEVDASQNADSIHNQIMTHINGKS